MSRMLNLSICVVLYRARAGTERFHSELLQSLAAHHGWELLYYDNSPTDELRAPLSIHPPGCRVSYVHDPRNLGFSYANNELILAASERRILLLNPDVYGFTPAHWDLIGSLDTSSCARFARLLNEDGSFQDCVGDVSSLRRALSPRRAHERTREAVQVGMGIMAFMLADRSVFARVGLLDCDYPLYAEDMDWCHRARLHGMPPIYDPRIELTHTGGASAGDRWSRRASLLRKYKAEGIFIDKHYRGIGWGVMRMLNQVKRLRTRWR